MENVETYISFVLFGKTGSGKSASGNTILGRNAFDSMKSSRTVTRVVIKKHGELNGLRVSVYDTPDFSGTEQSEEEIRKKYQSVLSSCESTSSISIYLLVLKTDRFTEEERKAVQKIEKLLGEDRLKNTWILFTGGDQLQDKNQTIEEFISGTDALKKLVQKYNERYYVFNNKSTENSVQVQKLLLKIGEHSKILLNSAKHLVRIKEDKTTTSRDSGERWIVLLGKTGIGKSATGNTILNQKCFTSEQRFVSVTDKSKSCQAEVEGRKLSVIDTPGLMDTSTSAVRIALEVARSVWISSPGPHAFLIVLKVTDRFTEQEMEIIKNILGIFGQEVLKYGIILFTYGDQLERNINELIKENEALKDLVQRCGGGFQVFNNKAQEDRQQVTELLEKIDRMVEQNDGSCYTNQMFQEAGRLKEEEKRKVARELEEKEQRKRKEIEEEMEKAKAEKETEIKEACEEKIRKLKSELEEIKAHEQSSTEVEMSPTFWEKYWKYIFMGVVKRVCTFLGF